MLSCRATGSANGMTSITLEQAKMVVAAAEQKAVEIGVSGGEVDQDPAVAEAGVDALAGVVARR